MKTMKSFITAFVGVLVASSSVFAGELAPMAAGSISLGEVTGSTFYTVEGDSFKVVTTLAAGEQATPIRFITLLRPGQTAVVSVPRGFGQSALEVEITRIDDQLFMNSPKTTARAID
jgi:hypothetical protein